MCQACRLPLHSLGVQAQVAPKQTAVRVAPPNGRVPSAHLGCLVPHVLLQPAALVWGVTLVSLRHSCLPAAAPAAVDATAQHTAAARQTGKAAAMAAAQQIGEPIVTAQQHLPLRSCRLQQRAASAAPLGLGSREPRWLVLERGRLLGAFDQLQRSL